ncbi:MAG TPA: YihY/virulence factor BrkB family protein [Allosphingosinicella sp.]|nr:YihY/virulence factor BrkB family protein [Allosphingosinicella sp.]HYG48849.1 YihY/virulence factor BrkB family protein [Allosphingosinicella sp.]
MAIQPVRWPALKDWRQVLVRTWKEAGDDNVGLLAAGVAFYAFLAFVPLLAATVLVYGLAAEPETVAEHIRQLFGVLPEDAAALIGDQLRSMTESPDSAKGWSLVVAIALAIYGASKGSGAIVTALNIAYEVKESRGFIKSTLLSLLMTVGALVILVIAAAGISVMGWVEAFFPGFPGWTHNLFQILFWAVAVVAVGAGLAAVYRYAPNRPDAPWAWITPGSATATLLWLAGSLGFGFYVSNFGNYNATYGSLGGVVVFLTWLYLSAYIVLMGGEMNSELERQQAIEAGLPARPAAAAAATTGQSSGVATDGKPERISWPMAAVGLVLSRTGGKAAR